MKENENRSKERRNGGQFSGTVPETQPPLLDRTGSASLNLKLNPLYQIDDSIPVDCEGRSEI